jgi:hypothetical protein
MSDNCQRTWKRTLYLKYLYFGGAGPGPHPVKSDDPNKALEKMPEDAYGFGFYDVYTLEEWFENGNLIRERIKGEVKVGYVVGFQHSWEDVESLSEENLELASILFGLMTDAETGYLVQHPTGTWVPLLSPYLCLRPELTATPEAFELHASPD